MIAGLPPGAKEQDPATWVKALVQSVYPISNGAGLALTTAHYFTPSGRSIQAKGVEPDIEVQPAKVETLATGGFRRAEGDEHDRADRVWDRAAAEAVTESNSCAALAAFKAAVAAIVPPVINETFQA